MHSNEGRTTVYNGNTLVNQLIYLCLMTKKKEERLAKSEVSQWYHNMALDEDYS